MADFRPAQGLVVAVSGGSDSMALLRLAVENLPRHQLVIAHFNHRLRGAESDGDEAFVRAEASRLGLPFRARRGDVRTAARGVSMEMAARKLRHEFLAGVAREFSADVLLAHHADDQIELFLMRLLRRARGPGIAGMKAQGPSPADSSVRLLRPLLEIRKATLLEFIARHGIAFREDSTNTQLVADRNRMRHRILPALRAAEGEGFDAKILAHIRALAALTKKMRETARDYLRTPRDFSKIPDWLQTEVIAVQLDDAGVPITGALLRKLVACENRFVSANASRKIARDPQGRIAITDRNPMEKPLSIDLSKPGGVDFAERRIEWAFPDNADLGRQSNLMIFDAARLGSRIVLRHYQPGDRIRLSGRSSLRPLHEMFSRNKIARSRRHQAIVASTEAGEIFWVEGLRITEDFKVTPGTQRFLEWRWRPQS